MKKINLKENLRDLSILIIDDDTSVQRIIKRILNNSSEHYFIETADNIESSLELIRKTYWDTILLDLSIPYKKGQRPDTKNGLNFLDEVKTKLNIATPIIAITGYGDEQLSDTVLDKGAYYFLNKPLRAKSLSAIVKNSTSFQMSGYDGLTGLLNRKTFEERLKSEFERVKRKNVNISPGGSNMYLARSYLSVIFFDGDNFKEINDKYSHLAGDYVLKEISSSFIDESLYVISDSRRESSKYIIRPYDLAARFGGDEFCLFLPETIHESALIVARRIREQIRGLDFSKIADAEKELKGTIDFSLSIGIATYPYPNDVENHTELIRLADEAMYASKELKKGFIYGYDSDGKLCKYD